VVERVVNGKIKRLQESLDEHREQSMDRHNEIISFRDELMPVLEALKFFNSGRKFTLWVKPMIPVFLFIGALYIAIKQMFK
jgi:hypothetical protein